MFKTLYATTTADLTPLSDAFWEFKVREIHDYMKKLHTLFGVRARHFDTKIYGEPIQRKENPVWWCYPL